MRPLDFTAQLNRLNLAPAVQAALEQAVQAQLAALQEQAIRDAERLKAKDLKLQALTLELAHLRRLRYGVKSEALSQVHQDLFEDTWNEDLAAVEAEVEQVTDAAPGPTVAKPKRPRARAPAANRCRPICRVSSTGTNRTPASVGSAARTW